MFTYSQFLEYCEIFGIATNPPSPGPYLPLAGGTMSGNINMNSVATITNVQNPLNPGDVVNLSTLTGYLQNSVPSAEVIIGNVSNVGTPRAITGVIGINNTGITSFSAAAAGTLLSNITGSSAVPTFNSLSSIMDAAFGNTEGDILVRGASNWQVLTPGTTGQFLQTQGAAALPTWANGNAGTVTSVSAGAGLAGGPITTSGALSLAATATLTLLSNITGGSAVPVANTLTSIIDASFSTTQGAVLYRNASAWVALPPGTAGTFLQTQGASANPQWASAALANINQNYLLANTTASPAAPVGTAVTTLLDSTFGNTQGGTLYRGASGWAFLGAGTSGQFLQTQGSSANPIWASGNAGTVTSVSAGTGLAGGPITGSGSLSLATIATLTLLSNVTGSTAAPTANTLTSILDASFSTTQGAVLYRGASSWAALAPGTSGQVFTTGGTGANPSWATAGTSGGYLVPQITILTAASGTYNTPANTVVLDVTVKGDGGGGGSGGGTSFATGGGQGAIVRNLYTTPASSYSYTVGQGAAQGANGTGSTFGSLSAGGGNKGTASGFPGAGGTPSGGNVDNIYGEPGGWWSYNGSTYYGGNGGGPGGGIGSSGGSSYGGNGQAPGSGGGGSSSNAGAGGTGAAGEIICIAWVSGSSVASGTISSGNAGQVAVYPSNGTTVGGVASSSVGGYRLISSQTASNSSSINFTGLTNGYSAYKLIISNLTASTNATSLLLRCSTNNGSSYDSGNNYQWGNLLVVNGTPNTGGAGGNGASSITLSNGSVVSNTNGQTTNLELTFFAPNSSSPACFSFLGQMYNTAGNDWTSIYGGGTYNNGSVNAIQFLMSGGNIGAGSFTLYGLPNV